MTRKNGRWAVDLAEKKTWHELTAREREIYSLFLSTAKPVDLFMLLRYAVERRPSTTFGKVKATDDDSSDS